MPRVVLIARATIVLLAAGLVAGPVAATELSAGCREDAMIVFDASGSMAGGEKLGIASSQSVTRIDNVRKALSTVLPSIAPRRRIGLVSYGPGPYNRCDNIVLNLEPVADAEARIMAAVNALVPAGRTPLTAAVLRAAEVLDYKSKPGVIVLLTDGEETCGGAPCSLARHLKATAANLVVHVIGYRMANFSWTGGQSTLDAKCLPNETGGHYFGVETLDELIAALEKALGCPLLTEALAAHSLVAR